MESFEQKSLENFGEVVIRKDLIRQAGFGARAIPTYVGEWILSDYLVDGGMTDAGRAEVSAFIGKYLPQKGQKNELKNKLVSMETVALLDDYSVAVNLNSGIRHLRIPLLDLEDAYINNTLVDDNPLLLTSGVWGVGELFYVPPDEQGNKGQVWMRDLEPFQIGSIDVDYYKNARARFSLDEWIDLLVSSMGFNPLVHTARQKMLLLTRILPLVEPRTNLVELAPKGTGKSFVFDNVSRYARVVGGGRVSAPVLFHHNVRQTPGLITRYDVVVLDEVQSVNDDSTGELVAGLKVYLESGRYSRGNTSGTAESGLVLLGNILLDENRKPMHSDRGIFNEFPNFLRETAFIDRLHGLLPGWELPRVTRHTPSCCIGFKGDFFSEVLHQLRASTAFADYASQNSKLIGCEDLRDQKAIVRLASGFMKLLYPDMGCSEDDFALHCLRPAVELRQRIRDELHKMDQEFAEVEIGIEGLSVIPTAIQSAPPEDPSQILEEESSEGSVGSLESRIARLEMLFPAVGSEIRKAQELSESQPDIALLSARRGLELLLREIYEKLIGSDPGRMPLFDMLTELDRGDYIPEPITQHLHSVRTLGNIAAHGDPTSVTSDDAYMAVLGALRTGEWAGERVLIRARD
ncbi:MAG: BREX system Lon protease-like protein BrxL [Armatimonadota bacterium]